eukprot:2028091-Rhodomonas_salina.1
MDGKRGWRTPDEELSQALQHAPALLRQVTLPAAPPSSLRESDVRARGTPCSAPSRVRSYLARPGLCDAGSWDWGAGSRGIRQ